jgi:uncharacterized membrane protein YkvA (DUF1232 family)
MKRTADFESWKTKAKSLKKEVYALSLAAKDPRVPWHAKVFAILIIGYILSPIDLIPDFIPVIGYVDDIIIVPAAIVILIRIIPKEVMAECREKASSHHGRMKGKHWIAASVIAIIWLVAIYATIKLVYYFILKVRPQ